MDKLNTLFQAIAVVLLLAVAYITFWVLVILFVVYIIYQIADTLKTPTEATK